MEVITKRGMVLSQRYLTRAAEALLVASKLDNPAMRKDAMEIVDLYLQLAAIELEWAHSQQIPQFYLPLPELRKWR